MVGASDKNLTADWSLTSDDYANFRPDPPKSFFDKLIGLGIGLNGQSIMDVGTGTGALARQFAAQGAHVSASDVAQGQVEAAKRIASELGLNINFFVGAAKNIDAPDHRFDVVTALQCWWYFDHANAIAEIRRVLKPGGKLVICSFSFLPKEDPIVAASEALVLKFSPTWSGAGWDGTVPIFAEYMPEERYLVDKFVYDEAIPFTRKSWRGRMRALRGIGASLRQDQVTEFDAKHDTMLKEMTDDEFTIKHRLDAHIYNFDGN